MAGLEDLSSDERAKFNLGTLVAQLMSDPKTSIQTKKLLKQGRPELSFPELDAEEAANKVRTETQTQMDELKTALRNRDARDALAEEDKKILAVGLDPKVVRKFMTDEGINNVDIVIELFESRQALAEPSTSQVGPFRFEGVTQDDLKNMWKDPVAWREQKAYEVINELRSKKRA